LRAVPVIWATVWVLLVAGLVLLTAGVFRLVAGRPARSLIAIGFLFLCLATMARWEWSEKFSGLLGRSRPQPPPDDEGR
jgi:hypothetical protein